MVIVHLNVESVRLTIYAELNVPRDALINYHSEGKKRGLSSNVTELPLAGNSGTHSLALCIDASHGYKS